VGIIELVCVMDVGITDVGIIEVVCVMDVGIIDVGIIDVEPKEFCWILEGSFEAEILILLLLFGFIEGFMVAETRGLGVLECFGIHFKTPFLFIIVSFLHFLTSMDDLVYPFGPLQTAVIV
jgi:hypothetical protein